MHAALIRLILAGLLMMALGCAAMRPAEVRYRPVFRYELVDVQRSASASERYGEHRIEVVQEAGTTKYRFEDQLARVVIYPIQSRISLSVTNKTDATIRIPWSSAGYVGIEGDSQRVMHGGEKYSDCAAEKPATVIPARGSLSDDVMPCGAVRATYSTWFAEPLLPEMRIAPRDTARIRAELQSSLVGKRFQLRLPLEVESVVSDYRFSFAITGFEFRAIDF